MRPVRENGLAVSRKGQLEGIGGGRIGRGRGNGAFEGPGLAAVCGAGPVRAASDIGTAAHI